MSRSSLIFLLVFILPVICNADKIYLKDGRVIQSNAVWKDGDQVKYRKFRAIVGLPAGSVDRIEKTADRPEDAEETDQEVVKFDIWPLGIHIRQAMDIAEMNNVPLHRAGLISANKGFNPVMSRKYMDTDSKFTYKTHLMGYMSEVALLFSPISRRLAHVEIRIIPRLREEREAAYHESMEVLTKKYGKPEACPEKRMLTKTFSWTAGDNGTIRLEKILSSLKITYMHNLWSNRMLVEQKQLSDQKTGRNNMPRETAKF